VKADEIAPHPGYFTEPMQAVLLDLSAQSPFPLMRMRCERSASGEARGELMPSRLNVQLGEESLWDPELRTWRDDLADEAKSRRAILDRLRNETGGAR
jgi:hypothetical protein